MSGRFIALREFKEGAGLVQPGSFVPGAEGWPAGIARSVVNAGYMYDLHRVIRSDDDRLVGVTREKMLLEAVLKQTGSTLIDDPDNKGRLLLVPVGDEANAIQRHRAAARIDARPSAAAPAPAAKPRRQRAKKRA